MDAKKIEEFNATFRTQCYKDHFGLSGNFEDLRMFIVSKVRLNIELPPLEISRPPASKAPTQLPQALPVSQVFQPIPWQPNRKRPQESLPQQKCSEDPPKRKLENLHPEERNDFVPANFLLKSTKKPADSPQTVRSGLSKPFVCPIKGQSEPAKESKLPGVDEKLLEMIESEIITRKPDVTWDDIAGLDFAKKTVTEVIVWPLQRPDLFKGIRAPPKGLLLFGPPGTGKTMIGKAIACEISATFFSISASSITSKWVGEGEKLVKALFAAAVQYQPSVIFIDEIDSLLSSRSDSEQEGSRRIKTEFLVQIDGAATNPDDRILLIGATNRPQELDDAIRRRLAKRMYIPLPNKRGRLQIVKNLLKKAVNELTEEECEMVAERAKGFSGSDLKNLCTEACMFPLRSAKDINLIKAEEIPPVKVENFWSAFEVIRASVSVGDTNELLEWNKNFGSFQFDYSELEN